MILESSCALCGKGNHRQWMHNNRSYHGKQPLTCYDSALLCHLQRAQWWNSSRSATGGTSGIDLPDRHGHLVPHLDFSSNCSEQRGWVGGGGYVVFSGNLGKHTLSCPFGTGKPCPWPREQEVTHTHTGLSDWSLRSLRLSGLLPERSQLLGQRYFILRWVLRNFSWSSRSRRFNDVVVLNLHVGAACSSSACARTYATRAAIPARSASGLQRSLRILCTRCASASSRCIPSTDAHAVHYAWTCNSW